MHQVSAVSTVKSGWGNNDFNNIKTLVDIFVKVNIDSKSSRVICKHNFYSYISQHPNCSACVTMVTGYIFPKENVGKNW